MSEFKSFKFVRLLFIFLNVIFALLGIAMLAIGLYVHFNKSNFLVLMPQNEYVNVVGVMIAAGVIVIVVSIIGFLGVWMESQCMLIIYFSMVLIVFSLEIAVGIIAFLYRGEIDSSLETQLLEGLRDDKKRESWDFIQTEFKCCGVNGPDDWRREQGTVPNSCCQFGCTRITGAVNAFQTGCYSMAKEYIKENYYTLGASGIALGVLQIFLMVIAMLMICCVRNKHRYLA